jgi:hypothetical protein
MHGRRWFQREIVELKSSADRVGLELKVVAHGGGHATSAEVRKNELQSWGLTFL